MVCYSVVLKRSKGSPRPDVELIRCDTRKEALIEMRKYVKKYGFSICESNGRFTIETLLLVEKEPVVGASVLSVKRYHELFDIYDNPLKEDNNDNP